MLFILCPLVFPHLPHVKQMLALITNLKCPHCSIGPVLLLLAKAAKWILTAMLWQDWKEFIIPQLCKGLFFFLFFFFKSSILHILLKVNLSSYMSGHSTVHLFCQHTLFSQTMWESLWGLCDTDNVIYTPVVSFSPSISITESSCCIVGSLACNASAVYSVCWGAAWQFQLSRDTLEGIST